MNKKKLINLLQENPDIYAAILFGSHAQGKPDRESDIDVALLYNPSKVPHGLDFLDFKQKLSDTMHQEVDVVLLNEASPIIAMQAMKTGSTLFIRNLKAYQNFEMKLITDYFDLKKLREPFEKNILKRKLHD